MLSPGWPVFLARVLAANSLMAGFLLLVNPSMEAWFEFGFWPRFAVMIGLCAGGAAIYAAGLRLAGCTFTEVVR